MLTSVHIQMYKYACIKHRVKHVYDRTVFWVHDSQWFLLTSLGSGLTSLNAMIIQETKDACGDLAVVHILVSFLDE